MCSGSTVMGGSSYSPCCEASQVAALCGNGLLGALLWLMSSPGPLEGAVSTAPPAAAAVAPASVSP